MSRESPDIVDPVRVEQNGAHPWFLDPQHFTSDGSTAATVRKFCFLSPPDSFQNNVDCIFTEMQIPIGVTLSSPS